MNILIVDDEFYIVKGIVKNIDWNRMGIDTVFTAYGMKQAQSIFLKEQIDILLSDIEMPKGSGLDLIEWAVSSGYNPVSLLLTGHKRFEYAQKAIHMKCINYILKPVENHVLETQIQCAVEQVQSNIQQNAAMIESFWRELLTSSAPLSDHQIKESLERMDVPPAVMENSFYMALIDIYPNAAMDVKDGLPLAIVQQVIFRQLYTEEVIPLIKIASNTLIALCPSNSYADFAEFYAACNSLLSELTIAADLKYAMYLGDRVFMNQTRESYQILCKCKESIMLNDSIVLPVHSFTASPSLSSEYAAPLIPMDKWLEWLLQLNAEKIIDDIKNTYFNYHTAYYPVSIIHTLYLGILKTVFKALENRRISSTEIFPELLPLAEIVPDTSSADTFIHWITSILNNTEELLNADRNYDSISYLVKKYVQEYIGSSELNRTFLARQIHLNPDYLSYLFHKQTGQALSIYILNERVEMAKKLLITSKKSLQEIVELTGFSNSSYFHKQFKKLTGMTPHQYRSKH